MSLRKPITWTTLAQRRAGASKTRLIFVLAVLGGFAVAAFFALRTDTASVSDLMDRANQALKVNDFQTAESAAARAIDKDPKNNRARLIAARSASAAKRPQQA